MILNLLGGPGGPLYLGNSVNYKIIIAYCWKFFFISVRLKQTKIFQPCHIFVPVPCQCLDFHRNDPTDVNSMINLMPFRAEVNKYMYFIICLSSSHYRSNYQEGRTRIPLIGLSQSHFWACLKKEPTFPSASVIVVWGSPE